MPRTVAPALALAALLAVAACGDDQSEPAAAATPDATTAPGDDAVAGESDGPDDAPVDSFEDVGPPPTNPDKPSVEPPAAVPDELVRTVLVAGDGPEAATGDTVIVDYIGVRMVDGVEFDNSYDRFEPFPVVLGQGGVIAGWDQGLLGARTGDRIQLDIPSELAYGDQQRGDVIRPDEPLTFVIDVRSVVKAPDPADRPTEPGVEASVDAVDVTTTDLVVGDGPVAEGGQTAIIHLVLFRGDNLVALDDTWSAEPIQIPLDETGFPALAEGIPGMQVGGRRTIVAPAQKAFGEEGNPPMGLPAATDVVLVVDLLGVY